MVRAEIGFSVEIKVKAFTVGKDQVDTEHAINVVIVAVRIERERIS